MWAHGRNMLLEETWSQTPFSGSRASCLPAWCSFRELYTCPFSSSAPTQLSALATPCLASSPPTVDRAPGKNCSPESGAGHPAAFPAGQSRRGRGGADGCQGQCVRQAEAKGRQDIPGLGVWAQALGGNPSLHCILSRPCRWS